MEHVTAKQVVEIGRSKMKFTKGLCSCRRIVPNVFGQDLPKDFAGHYVTATENDLYTLATSDNTSIREDSPGVFIDNGFLSVFVPFDQKVEIN